MVHEMAIIESLDPDTETRRLSPVAIFGKLKMLFYKHLVLMNLVTFYLIPNFLFVVRIVAT